MTDHDEDHERLRRHLRALSAVNRQLRAQLDDSGPGRRPSPSRDELDALIRSPEAVELVRRDDGGLVVLEGGVARPVRSGLLAAALEAEFGPRRLCGDDEAAGWVTGASVEVFEAPTGAPFVVVGGRRLPVRGLPLPTPIAAEDALAIPEGPALHLRSAATEVPPTEPLAAMPLPTFLIIGAQKSATRWLRTNLGLHPEIFAAAAEPSFFNHEKHFHEDGLDWYRQQFQGWAGETAVGESTPGYMMWRHQPEVVARRVEATLPDVRLIAILRNPIDRAHSAMVHHVRRDRLPADSTLLDLAGRTPPEKDRLGLIAGSWYAASLKPFFRRFGDRLLVLIHDDLAVDAEALYRRTTEHIGVAGDFVPPELAEVRFSNQGGSSGGPSEEDRVALYSYFRDDVDELEQMLDRDLSAWDPTRGT